MLVFWTPRLTPWVLAQARRAEVPLEGLQPAGVRLWEQWSLVSRDALDPGVIGVYRDMAVWAEVEGLPQPEARRTHGLSVLRAGALVPTGEMLLPTHGGSSWASAASFEAVSELCHHFLRWDRFSVRAVRPRAIFEWENRVPWQLEALGRAGRGAASSEEVAVHVVPACDGPLTEVVRHARQACGRLGTGPGIRVAAPAAAGEAT
jgi:hypothetical protein